MCPLETDSSPLREGEAIIETLPPPDVSLIFIGTIHTPWTDRRDCPRQGRQDGEPCRVEVYEPWAEGLRGIEDYAEIELLYWLHRSRRDVLLQNPKHDAELFGTFALRSPLRPNPIGTSRVRLEEVSGRMLTVRGLDCLDGTPLVDIKPDRCSFSPKVAPKPGVD